MHVFVRVREREKRQAAKPASFRSSQAKVGIPTEFISGTRRCRVATFLGNVERARGCMFYGSSYEIEERKHCAEEDILVIPSISTSSVGPLGVMHLPRLWLKNLLFSADRREEAGSSACLAPDYKHTTGTFDRMVMEARIVGIDSDQMLAYFQSAKPSYLQFEAWVQTHAAHLGEDVIADLNQRYRDSLMSESGAEIRRAELGLTDDTVRQGILLNDLDDWSALHHELNEPGKR